MGFTWRAMAVLLLTMICPALSGCGRQDQAVSPQSGDGAEAAIPPADRQLIASGATPAQIAAARAYLVPFTRADQSACFHAVAPTVATMAGPPAAAFATAPGVSRVVVAIDGSGSMAATIGGRTKLTLAKEATLAFLDGLGPDVTAAVFAFGVQGDNTVRGKARSCQAIDQVAAMSLDRAAQRRAVQAVRAVGWTPLAAALSRAQAQLGAAPPGKQVIYVVSDGNETCGGDPVAAARAINNGATHAVVNIIGFDLPAADRAALQSVAGAGGGALIDIADDASYRRMLAATRERMRLSDNKVRASNARAGNAIDTGAAITQATICTGDIITRETLAVGNDLTAREAAKQPIPPRRVAFALLDQRHKALTATRQAYETRMRAGRERSITAVDAQEKAAR